MERLPDGLAMYRDRILARARHPCRGRFDSVWDIEQDFKQAVQDFKQGVEKLASSTPEDNIDEHIFLSGLLFECSDIEAKVYNAWDFQDKAIEQQRIQREVVSPKKSSSFQHHKNQTKLF